MFVHLHTHTEYSLLDGTCRIKELVERIRALGMDACAITDHDVMYGVVEFYLAAREAGIRPVIGCELDVCLGASGVGRLVLLCENDQGYRNLCALLSEAWLRGGERPLANERLLLEHREGLIALSGGLDGVVGAPLLAGNEAEAREAARCCRAIFGAGNFYIELQNHGLPEQQKLLPGLLALSRELDIPAVCTNDCRHLAREDFEAQAALSCVGSEDTLAEAMERLGTDQRYVKSEAEMRAAFPELRDAVERSEEIAMRCHVELSAGSLPRFPLPEGEADSFSYLKKLCAQGFERRYGPDFPEGRERLAEELATIEALGCADSFLFANDIAHNCLENRLFQPRGGFSAPGSIVNYALGITRLDPIEHGLIFERFLNPKRMSAPEFAFEGPSNMPDKVLHYLQGKLGSKRVARIVAIPRMLPRDALRFAGRALGMDFERVDAVAKRVSPLPGAALERAMRGELGKLCEQDAELRRLVELARRLEGLPRRAAVHAASLMISDGPATERLALQKIDGEIVAQLQLRDVKALGMLEMDLLPMRTLDEIELINLRAIRLAERLGGEAADAETRARKLVLYHVAEEDAGEVFARLAAGDTEGVFPFDSEDMRELLRKLRPESIEELAAAIALNRPGMTERIPSYLEGKANPAGIQYLAPELEPILKETCGCVLYQEQLMRLLHDLAGYSMARADLVRRALVRGEREALAEEREVFLRGQAGSGAGAGAGCAARGLAEDVAGRIFDELILGAAPACLKAQALSRAGLAAVLVNLKLRYPEEFAAVHVDWRR